MEMFNKKELDNRIGPLKKDKKLYDLEQVEGYVIKEVLSLAMMLWQKKCHTSKL